MFAGKDQLGTFEASSSKMSQDSNKNAKTAWAAICRSTIVSRWRFGSVLIVRNSLSGQSTKRTASKRFHHRFYRGPA